MQGKTRRTLMALVGAYLIYNGVKLIMDVMQGSPNYKTLLIVFGVIFIVFGGATLILNIRELLKEMKAEKEESGDMESEADGENGGETQAVAERTGNPTHTGNTERVWKAPTVADEKESVDEDDGEEADEDEVMMDEDAEPLDDEPDFSELDEEEWGTASEEEEADEESEE
ncbi:MAG: hypothetical protein ACI4F1_03375 [Bariatricus sp.]